MRPRPAFESLTPGAASSTLSNRASIAFKTNAYFRSVSREMSRASSELEAASQWSFDQCPQQKHRLYNSHGRQSHSV